MGSIRQSMTDILENMFEQRHEDEPSRRELASTEWGEQGGTEETDARPSVTSAEEPSSEAGSRVSRVEEPTRSDPSESKWQYTQSCRYRTPSQKIGIDRSKRDSEQSCIGSENRPLGGEQPQAREPQRSGRAGQRSNASRQNVLRQLTPSMLNTQPSRSSQTKRMRLKQTPANENRGRRGRGDKRAWTSPPKGEGGTNREAGDQWKGGSGDWDPSSFDLSNKKAHGRRVLYSGIVTCKTFKEDQHIDAALESADKSRSGAKAGELKSRGLVSSSSFIQINEFVCLQNETCEEAKTANRNRETGSAEERSRRQPREEASWGHLRLESNLEYVRAKRGSNAKDCAEPEPRFKIKLEPSSLLHQMLAKNSKTKRKRANPRRPFAKSSVLEKWRCRPSLFDSQMTRRLNSRSQTSSGRAVTGRAQKGRKQTPFAPGDRTLDKKRIRTFFKKYQREFRKASPDSGCRPGQAKPASVTWRRLRGLARPRWAKGKSMSRWGTRT